MSGVNFTEEKFEGSGRCREDMIGIGEFADDGDGGIFL